jgi:hypothetical protein
MADVNSRTEDWNTLPWKNIQRNVFHLQKRIYRAVYCSTLQCRTTERRQVRPRLAAIAAAFLVGALSSSTSGDAGQSRQTHTGGGRGSVSHPAPTDANGQ